MMYSKKTLVGFTKKAHETIQEYMNKPLSDLHVHISQGNAKIGKVHNFSIMPVITCNNCANCAAYCYDVKACLCYGNVMRARAENTALLYRCESLMFDQIDRYISSKKTNKFFRWHVGGELPSVNYFAYIVNIAEKHPDWTFWLYTKMYSIVNLWCLYYGRNTLPDNLSVMFSEWNGVSMDNRYNFPTFTCVQADMEEPKDVWKCPGNCDICKKAHRGCINGESAYTYEH